MRRLRLATVATLLVLLALVCPLVAQNPVYYNLQTTGAVGNGTAVTATGYTVALVQVVTGSGFDRTITFELSTDGTNYGSTSCKNIATLTQAATATATGQYACGVAGGALFRARVSGGTTSGTLAVTTRLLANAAGAYGLYADYSPWADDGTEIYPKDLTRRVGIGTAAPTSLFHIAASGGPTIKFQRTDSLTANFNMRIEDSAGNADATIAYNNTTGSMLTLDASGVSRVSIDSGSADVVFGIGQGTTTLSGSTLRGPNAAGTDIAGVTTTLAASRGTGAGNAGILAFNAMAQKGTTGTTVHTPSTLLQLGNTHAAAIGTTGLASHPAVTYVDRATAGAGTVATTGYVTIGQMTLQAANAITDTDAASLYIAGAPIKSTNVTATNVHGLLIGAGAVSTASNSYGLTVNAQSGASANYAAQFAGGNVGIGTAAPAAFLHVLGTTEQQRLAYDASNYAALTVGSTGVLTLNVTGSANGFTVQRGGSSLFSVSGSSPAFVAAGNGFSTSTTTDGYGMLGVASTWTSTSGMHPAITVTSSFAPTSTSTMTAIGANIAPTINYSNGTPGAGSYEGIRVNVTETALPTGSNYLIRAGTGGGSFVEKFSIDRNGRMSVRVSDLADSTSITPTGDTVDLNTHTNSQAAGTLTVNAPSGTPISGQRLELRIKSTNVQTFSWNAIYRGSTDLALPTATTGSSKVDYILFQYNSTDTKWDLLAKTFGY